MIKRGIFSTLQNYLERRRVGELLVTKGLISTKDLKSALKEQKQSQKPLGEIFVEKAYISRTQLSYTLFKQTALRTAATFVLCFASVTSLNAKKATADTAPAFTLVSASADFKRVASYPSLYGMSEKRSTNLSAFTKWTGVLNKFERQMKKASGAKEMQAWKARLEQYKGLSLKRMADKVNDMVNEKRYILDSKNWGTSDYWATPIEFMQRGGDCEDFAIAKYVSLRAMGVPEERLRLAIVQDTVKNIPHAVLVVYTEQGAYILDNQIKSLVDAERGTRYRPIYSINRTAWWLHSAPKKTIIASAR